ncbi:MAG: FAD-dependent oxidoreductase [Candidatus Nealsonbacteria bacterium]
MKNTYDVIIIGGGPAGMTAGIYTARQKLKTLLITKNFGGQMARKIVAIENYPGFEKISGLELIQKFEKQLRSHEIDIETNATVNKVKKTGDLFSVQINSKKNFKAKAVIIASGADPRPLEVPGEKKFIGHGVSYCTACDGPLFVDKNVVVVGGGNSGFEAAVSLSSYVKKIYLLEKGKKLLADEDNQARARATGKIEVIIGAGIKKIQGKDFVDSVVYQDTKTNKLNTLSVEGVFVEIGSQPATSFVKDLVDFNEKDEIMADAKTSQTKTKGLFSAGDVDNVPYKQIVIACGEGAKAALSVAEYLKKNARA